MKGGKPDVAPSRTESETQAFREALRLLVAFGVGAIPAMIPSPNPEPVLVRESSCPAWGWKGFSDEEATQRRADREPASTG